MSMVGPFGVLPMGLALATTEVGEDADGGPLGVLPACLAAATTEVGEDVDSGPLGGAIIGSGSGHHRS
jgi:hypothetical protein